MKDDQKRLEIIKDYIKSIFEDTNDQISLEQ